MAVKIIVVNLLQIREKLAGEKQSRENSEKVKQIRRMKQFGKKVCSFPLLNGFLP